MMIIPTAAHATRFAGKQLGGAVLQALVPWRCVFCGVATSADEGAICEGCNADLPWIGRACSRCAVPIPAAASEATVCADCQTRPPPWSAAVAALEYSFPVDAAIKAWKFQRRLHYQPAFAAVLGTSLHRLPADIDAVLPIPLHRWRRIRRGFNQARELALPVARKLRLPLADCLQRRHTTPYQSALSASERRSNLRQAFRLTGSLDAHHVLVVDDVMTTGETVREVTRVLRQSGIGRISILALARATSRD